MLEANGSSLDEELEEVLSKLSELSDSGAELLKPISRRFQNNLSVSSLDPRRAYAIINERESESRSERTPRRDSNEEIKSGVTSKDKGLERQEAKACSDSRANRECRSEEVGVVDGE